MNFTAVQMLLENPAAIALSICILLGILLLQLLLRLDAPFLQQVYSGFNATQLNGTLLLPVPEKHQNNRKHYNCYSNSQYVVIVQV
jgi:hypothetical protein